MVQEFYFYCVHCNRIMLLSTDNNTSYCAENKGEYSQMEATTEKVYKIFTQLTRLAK